MENFIGIYNEEGNKDNDIYEIIGNSTGTKNVIRIRNRRTGGKRLIHKDRIFAIETDEKRRIVVEKEKKPETNKKAKKKKKAPAKFDLAEIRDMGILFKAKNKKTMEAGEQKITVESYVIVSNDATKCKYFNLYDHSLGKKAKSPEFGENDVVKGNLSGDLSAIEEYLTKKGYHKI